MDSRFLKKKKKTKKKLTDKDKSGLLARYHVGLDQYCYLGQVTRGGLRTAIEVKSTGFHEQ